MVKIVLEPCGIRCDDNWTGVYWQVDAGDKAIQIEHSVPEAWAHILPDPDNGDHILLATLLYAMEKGSSLEIRGSVSSKLLDGVEHLQEIWNRWRPERYKKIDIQCQREQQRQPVAGEEGLTKSSGLFAFSGGVDATFTLMRHFYGDAGRQTVKPKAALLIQGFDIPYTSDHDYKGAFQRAEQILEECHGVRLIGMRTNSRAICQDWEDSHGLQLGACLLLLEKNFSHAIQAGDEPYDQLVLPWGSTPLTIPLMSTESLLIVQDGCGHDRIEKVGYISRNTNASDHIRVCWAGDQLDRNCGKCEKCIRTMLNYWCSSLSIPNSLPGELNPRLIKSVTLRNDIQASYLFSIRSVGAKRNPHDAAILRAIDNVLFRYKYRFALDAPCSISSYFKSQIKRLVKSVLRCS